MSQRDFAYYQNVMGRIARDPKISQGNRTEALRALTREISLAVDADYVGFWSYDDARTRVTSEANFERAKNLWSDGHSLSELDAPTYFASLKEERLVDVEDCFTSPITAEFKESYCVPNDIRSLLDVPVLFDGEIIGIICCEVVGAPRSWTNEDKFFALIAADFVGRVIESDQRRHLANLLKKENLQMGETQLKALLTALPLPIAMLDRESRYMAMSDSWLQQYTFCVANPFGTKLWDAHATAQQAWIDRIMRCQENGERSGLEEEYVELAPGHFGWVSWQIAPWHTLEGEIGGVVMTCEDITYRKEAEAKMNQTTKLTALGEMAGGIAHEINNPLSIIKGFIDLMQKSVNRGQFDAASFGQYLEKSANTVQRMSRIVQSMKRISRDSSQDAVIPYGVNALIDEVLDVVQEKFRDNGVRLEISHLPLETKVSCRPVEISQVLLNLLTNAFHAVEKDKGSVRLSVSIGPSCVRLQVADSGGGIPAEIREKIFQPFFTTKDIGKGTGLGLSISRKILESHGGKLYLDPTVKETTFIAELPLS